TAVRLLWSVRRCPARRQHATRKSLNLRPLALPCKNVSMGVGSAQASHSASVTASPSPPPCSPRPRRRSKGGRATPPPPPPRPAAGRRRAAGPPQPGRPQAVRLRRRPVAKARQGQETAASDAQAARPPDALAGLGNAFTIVFISLLTHHWR